MTNEVRTKRKSGSKVGRVAALAALGLATATMYAAPTLVQLDQAQAQSGGGFFSFGGGGSGGGGGMGGSGAVSAATDPTALKECGACHDPYAPRYLPAGSWQKMINDLENHFGEDAWLPDETKNQVLAYYVNNAGGQGTGALRITETRWFQGEHRGEVRQSSIQKAGGMHNCSACHFMPGVSNRQGGGMN